MISRILGILPLFLFIFSCTRTPQQPDCSIPQFPIQYILHLDSSQVSVTIECNEAGLVTFILPTFYADNPLLLSGPNYIESLRVVDSCGHPLSFKKGIYTFGEYASQTISLDSSAVPFFIHYWLNFSEINADPSKVPRVFYSNGRGYLQGNYLFAVPQRSQNIQECWRDSLSLHFSVNLPDGTRWFGNPIEGIFHNIYELAFFTATVNPELLFSGSVNTLAYQFVNISGQPGLPSHYQILMDRTDILFSDILSVFGPLENEPYTIILNDMGGALEGMYAFNIDGYLTPEIVDSPYTLLYDLLAHEFIHSWIGVRTGDYEDPWWKEGTTNYLGLKIAARNKLLTAASFEFFLLQNLSGNQTIQSLPLSQPRVREQLFTRDKMLADEMYRLVYFKGAQVNMLLDLALQESKPGVNLEKVLDGLIQVYRHGAFHRSDFIGLIENMAGFKSDSLFAVYVDQPGVIADSLLQSTYQRLIVLGNFGSDFKASGAKRTKSSGNVLFKK